MTPREAYNYACEKGGSGRLRTICCLYHFYAYMYALYVDKVPKEETRKGACKYPYYAYLYAKDIDEGYHQETRNGCYKSNIYYMGYLRNVLKSKYYEELNLMPYIKRVSRDS